MQLILALLASLIIRLLRLTWRVRLVGPNPFEVSAPRIFCFWHGRQAGLFAHPQQRRVAVLSSLSRDGTLQARILRLLGFIVLRGSSSRRGAAGLKALVDEVCLGADAAFAVDGPRGPAFEIKAGAIVAAQKVGGSLVPITVLASSYWRFSKAWDDYRLPKPFARVDLVRGDAIDASDREIEPLVQALKTRLNELESGVS